MSTLHLGTFSLSLPLSLCVGEESRWGMQGIGYQKWVVCYIGVFLFFFFPFLSSPKAGLGWMMVVA